MALKYVCNLELDADTLEGDECHGICEAERRTLELDVDKATFIFHY
jgi:hypothetical protein